MNRWTRRSASMMIAADASQRLRSALEVGMVAATVMLVTAIAAASTEVFIARAQISEASGLSSTVRFDLIVYRASHGHWPTSAADTNSSTLNETGSLGSYVARVDLHDEGSFAFTFKSDEKTASVLYEKHLTFRPGLAIGASGLPISWYCGGRRPPPGIEILADDRTDIQSVYLTHDCRQD